MPTTSEPIRDYEIRDCLHSRLELQFGSDKDTLIIDELGLSGHRARVDVAVINGHLIGYEIKGDFDTVRRLAAQIHAYSTCMDSIWVVSTPRHLKSVRAIVPQWCGLLEARREGQDIQLSERRKARVNRGRRLTGVASLLWRTELVELLQHCGSWNACLRHKSKPAIAREAARQINESALRDYVRERLRARGRLRIEGKLFPPLHNPDAPTQLSSAWIEMVHQLAAAHQPSEAVNDDLDVMVHSPLSPLFAAARSY
jgi:hypothetical protein